MESKKKQYTWTYLKTERDSQTSGMSLQLTQDEGGEDGGGDSQGVPGGFRLVKNLPAMQETLVHFLGQEDPLEKG